MRFIKSYIWQLESSLSLVLCFFSFQAYSEDAYFFAVVLFLLALFLQWRTWHYFRRRMEDSEKVLAAIYQKDFSLFPEKKWKDSLKTMSVQLYYQAKREHHHIYSYKTLYDSILDKMEIGFLILNKSTSEEEWTVFYCNTSFTKILDLPKYKKWTYYKDKMPDFYALIEETQFQDSQDFIDISIRESTAQSFSVRTSRLTNFQNDFCVISLESIQKIIDKKEKQAWNNLMKVISHELLNTLTPVNSLIQNLEYLTEQEDLTTEDQEEIKESLKIINSKSQQLLHFIDSYRQIAELPKPKKTRVNLKDIVKNVAKLFENSFNNSGIVMQFELNDYFLLVDQSMMERVLINLLTNAQTAVQLQEEKTIIMRLFECNHRIVLSIEDNGPGVDSQIESKIFLPFFTTRINGSGIGLTLSKSIVEAHDAYLIYRRLEKGSAFEICFISQYS